MARQTGPRIASEWTLDNKSFLAGLREGETRSKRAARRVVKDSAKMARGFANVGSSIKLAFAGFVGFQAARKVFKVAIGGAASLQTEIFKIGTLSEEAFFKMSVFKEGVKDIGEASGEEFNKLATSLFDIVSAGIPAGDALAFLKDTSTLAIAGVTDVDVALQGLLGIIKGYNLEASEATAISDALFVAMQKGRTDIGQLSSSIAPVIPLARQAGLSFDEMLSAVSAITLVTGDTNLAVTQLQALLVAVARNTDDARFGMERLKEVGIVQFMDEVAAATKLNSDALFEMFGRQEAVSGAINVAGDGAKNFKEILETTADAEGLVAKKADLMGQSFERQSARVKRTFERVFIDLGELILPKLGPQLEKAAADFKAFTRANEDEINAFVEESLATLIKVGKAFAQVAKIIAPALDEILLLAAVRVGFITAKFALWVAVLASFAEHIAPQALGVRALLVDIGILDEKTASAKDEFGSAVLAIRDWSIAMRAAGIDILKMTAELTNTNNESGKSVAASRAAAEALDLLAKKFKQAAEAAQTAKDRARAARDEIAQIKPGAKNDPKTLEIFVELSQELGTQLSILQATTDQERERRQIIFESQALYSRLVNEILPKLPELTEDETDAVLDLVAAIEQLQLSDLSGLKAEQFAEDLQAGVKGSLAAGLADGFQESDFLESLFEGVKQTLAAAVVEGLLGDAIKEGSKSLFQAILGIPAEPKQFGGLVTRSRIIGIAENEPERVVRERDFQSTQSELRELRSALLGGGGGGAQRIELVASSIVERGFESSTRLTRKIQDLSTAPPTSLRAVRARRRR